MARYIDVEPLEDKLKEHIRKTEMEGANNLSQESLPLQTFYRPFRVMRVEEQLGMLAIVYWLAVGSNPTTRLIASLAECALYGKMAVENQGCECVGGIKVCKKRLFPNAPILGRKERR